MTNRKQLNRLEINDIPLGTKGVYMLYKSGVVIYAGQSDGLRERLTHHKYAPDDPCIKRKQPNEFRYEQISWQADRDKRERELIWEYQPDCNDT